MELQRALADYNRNRIAVFAISYDSVEVLAAFSERHQIGFPLLSDQGSRVITALGMLNEGVYDQHAFYGVAHQDFYWGVPYAGAFSLNEQGVVTDKRFQTSYRMRESGVAMLEESFGVASTSSGPHVHASGPGVALRAHLDTDTYRTYQRLRLTLELAIEPGLHVYGQPIPEGYQPLEIEVEPIEGLLVGALEGPAPQPFQMQGLDDQFFVHSGATRWSLPLTFTQKMGDLRVRVLVRYQACSEHDCLLPAQPELELPLTERNHVEAIT